MRKRARPFINTIYQELSAYLPIAFKANLDWYAALCYFYERLRRRA